MSTAQKYASSNAVVTTGWTNPTNAYLNDGSNFATAAPAKNATVNSDFGFANFTTGDIPDGATINSVQMRFYAQVDNAIITVGVQGRDSGANSGSEATGTPNIFTMLTATLSGVTLADLRSASTLLKARVRATKGSTNTAYASQMDWVDIIVDYTAATGASLKVRRSSAWTAGAVKVRRSSAWVAPTSVKVRRSGAWTTVT